jgi:hypothetical protein
LRHLLTGYLAFVVAVAPCLCCCAAERVLAAAPPAQVETSVPCCCCHEADATPASQPVKPAPHMPQRCPCRDHAEKPAFTVPAANLSQYQLPVAGDMLLPALAILVPAVNVGGSADRHEPFRSVSDLLHVHHRLRC